MKVLAKASAETTSATSASRLMERDPEFSTVSIWEGCSGISAGEVGGLALFLGGAVTGASSVLAAENSADSASWEGAVGLGAVADGGPG